MLVYSVPIQGGKVVTLSQYSVIDPIVERIEISPNSKYVVMQGVLASNLREIFRVPIGGGTNVKLNSPLQGFDGISAFDISADSQIVLYYDSFGFQGPDIYSVPLLQGGNAVKLNVPPMAGHTRGGGISPDSSRAVMLSGDYQGIYTVSINGGNPTKISKPNVVNGAIADFKISPDSSRVVYKGDVEVDGQNELFSVLITGGPVTKLSAVIGHSGPLHDVSLFDISPNSSRVVYVADAEVDNRNELYSVLIAGGGLVKLNDPLLANQDVLNVQTSPSSGFVGYFVDDWLNQTTEVYTSPIGGGGATKRNGPLVPGGRVGSYKISPFSTRLIYTADQDVDAQTELYGELMAL